MNAGTFDVIVVGGGSAGCVVAARLSEDPSVRVLLLEAGGEATHPKIDVPAGFYDLFRTEVDWAFETEPEPYADGRRWFWPRGKVLGGSSAINAMIYMRGHPDDFDHWAEVSHPRWRWDSVLRLFRASEDQSRGEDRWHGVGGPLPVSDLRAPRPVSRAFVDAAVEAGLPRNPDFNGAEQRGAGLYQVTQRDGRRASTEAAFLRPARRRPNLEVRTGCRGIGLVLDGDRVTGVDYLRDGRAERVAGGEVVLSAGAIGSPHLLLLSGVGDPAALESVGVPIRHPLSGVGAELQDHPVVPIVAHAATRDTLDRIDRSPVALLRWLLGRRGPLTSNAAEAGAFLHASGDTGPPSLQLHFIPAWGIDHGFQRPAGRALTCGVTLVRPESRGRISLASSDPTAAPRIEGRYFEAPNDLARMIDGIRTTREILGSEALARWRRDEALPGVDAESDAELEAHVRRWGQTLYHPTSTCRMGVDGGAVVDPELRVRGLEGVRVADASIMPRIVNCNTNAASIMIGEMAAELLSGRAPESCGTSRREDEDAE